ncbi:MAG: hypothetical protein V3T22_10100, partial [Planctomycetota bacterium]
MRSNPLLALVAIAAVGGGLWILSRDVEPTDGLTVDGPAAAPVGPVDAGPGDSAPGDESLMTPGTLAGAGLDPRSEVRSDPDLPQAAGGGAATLVGRAM